MNLSANPTTKRKTCKCGREFDALVFPGIEQKYCDPCVQQHDENYRRLLNPERNQQAVVKSCVPAGYQDYDAAKLPASTLALATAKIFTWSFGPVGVGLGGESDKGKSYVIFELARRWQEHGKRIAVIKDQEVARIVRENSPRRDRLIADCERAEIIVWDDFGLSKMTDAVEGTYNDLLEIANSKNIPIFGTCNFGGEATKKKWAEQMQDRTFLESRGERIVRRFRDRCAVELLK